MFTENSAISLFKNEDEFLFNVRENISINISKIDNNSISLNFIYPLLSIHVCRITKPHLRNFHKLLMFGSVILPFEATIPHCNENVTPALITTPEFFSFVVDL